MKQADLVIKELQKSVDDPMWANHAEIPKILLVKAIDTIQQQAEEIKVFRAFVKNVIEESQDDQLFQQWVVEDGLIDGNGNPTKLLTGENNG